jgi:hypothetical protein
MIISDSITFEEAINFTQSLLEAIDTEKINDRELETTLTKLIATMNGARGFFVTYLTADYPWVDAPSPAIIKALQTSPETVAELMVKNLVMSTGMVITHERNGDAEMAANSQKVARRSVNLISKLELDILNLKLKQMGESLSKNLGEYQEFLDKWQYDDEQKQAMYEAVISCQN